MCNSIRLDDHGNDDDDNGGYLVMRKEYGRIRLPACLVLACFPQPHGDSRERETVDEDDDLLSCGQPFIYPMKVYVADLARICCCRICGRRRGRPRPGARAEADGHKQTEHGGLRNKGGAKPQQIAR